MQAESKQAHKGKGRILIVDDNKVVQIQLKEMLSSTLYDIQLASCAHEARQLAFSFQPHLILLDVMLPGETGLQVCKDIKNNEKTSDIPVVFISGRTEKHERIEGLQMGALDYITKPVEKEILITKVKTFVQLCRDARSLREIHAELKESHAELRQFSQALDNASDSVVITDCTGRITYANQSFELLGRYYPQTDHDLLIKSYLVNKEDINHLIGSAMEGTADRVETFLKRGTMELPVLVKCSAIQDQARKPRGLMFQIIDQTELKQSEEDRKRLEIELFHAQKLESVGQLASGIAHEINTPVQFVGDNIRFLQDALEDLFALQDVQQNLLEEAQNKNLNPELISTVKKALDSTDVEYLKEELPAAITQSLEGVGRVASIVRAMKEFAHPGTLEKAPANLNEAISTTITVARNKWKYVATLETELDDNLPLVPCLISEFNQVILNLIVNASDAISERMDKSGNMGLIHISTQCNETLAEIRIKDTGGGIPEDIQSRIFDPFFTTKEVGKGSGQGLAIARGVIVNKHQGEFFFETEENQGTTFIIQLPLKPAA